MHYRTRLLLILVLVLAPGVCAAGTPTRTERVDGRGAAAWRWDTHDDFDECYRDRYLDSEAEPGSVMLVRGMVIADEMGAGYNDYQPISGKLQARKILMLDSPDVSAATLLIGGGVKGCDILVNGRVLGAEPLERSYWHADFERYEIPPELLKAGANEFIFRARDGGSGSIRIERSEAPNRSAASADGGSLWNFDHLGEGGYINGELQVRLNVVRYGPEAWIHSPVLDLATCVTFPNAPVMKLDGDLMVPTAYPSGGLPAGVDWRVENLVVDADVPRGTRLEAFVRTGETPDGYEENWTRWHAWPQERDGIEFGRFAQWRLVLGTGEAQKTPVVRSVALRASARPLPAGQASEQVRLVEDANERIVRSSYPFAYGAYGGKLGVLRDHWKLADVVAGAETEMDKLKALRQWVRNQWTNGWSKGALNYTPSWDARVILTLTPDNLSQGMCTHYATTYVQCSQAVGYTSRSIFRGHALSETWSNDLKKWIVMDAGMDPNDRRRSTYHFERNGLPLNELEVHKAYYVDKRWDDISVAATNMSEGTEEVEEPFVKDVEGVIKGTRQMFMPLRNNFIDHREPEEPVGQRTGKTPPCNQVPL